MNNEPVAWMWEYMNDWHFSKEPVVFPAIVSSPVLIPLYTHPAKTLTDEEVIKIIKRFIGTEPLVHEIEQAILRKAQE